MYIDEDNYPVAGTFPIVAESVADAVSEFARQALDAQSRYAAGGSSEFHVFGKCFDIYDYFNFGKFEAPSILTLDEWYKDLE